MFLSDFNLVGLLNQVALNLAFRYNNEITLQIPTRNFYHQSSFLLENFAAQPFNNELGHTDVKDGLC